MPASVTQRFLLLATLFPSAAGWAGPATKNWGQEAMAVTEARAIASHSDKKIVVAVIDTGLDVLHPKLKNSVWTNPGETGLDQFGRDKSTNGVDDDKNGFIDDFHGWNFVKNKPDVADENGHGTHIAGIIQSVTPNVQLMVLKYYDPTSQGIDNMTNTLRAIDYAIAMHAQIINYSGGGYGASPEEENALKRARDQGILVVAAAGNESRNTDGMGYYPADYDLDNILSVAALDMERNLAKSSNYGFKTVDLAAPGKDVDSTLPMGASGRMSGTSQATAFATGAAALLLSQSPIPLSPASVIRQLALSSTPIQSLTLKIQFAGMINSARALAMKDTDCEGAGFFTKDASLLSNSDFFPQGL